MREFIDKDHRDVMDAYYDISEQLNEGVGSKAKIKKDLIKLINKDPYFFDSYTTLYHILTNQKKDKEAIKLLNDAYKKCLEVILDKKGKWPDLIEWGFLENRHVVRILINKAILEWELGNVDEALSLFKNLLRTNPRDNVGARFYILAIKMNMTFDDYEDRFNRGGYYDNKSWEWFNENVQRFPEEFKEWMEAEN